MLNDQDLVRALRVHDPRAFERVYDRHCGQALAIALRVCQDHDAAEDVVQQAFLEIWHAAHRYDPARGPLAAWIMTVVRHRAIDAVRRRGKNGRWVADGGRMPEEAGADDTAELAVGRATGALVRKALCRLPVAQRTALTMAYDDELSHPEIAAALGIPLGTVKSRTRLGLATLRVTPEMVTLAG